VKVAGVDFTSAPSRRKPIVVATGVFEGCRIAKVDLQSFSSASLFRAFLESAEFNRVGIDAPLSLPTEFLETVGIASWEESIMWASAQSKDEYFAAIRAFVTARPAGNKEPKRACDKLLGAASPLKLFNPGVGWMHFALAKHLLNLPVAVLPFQTLSGAASLIEVYPGAFAKQRLGNLSYKNDSPGDTERPERRERLLLALDEFLEISPAHRKQAVLDAHGDHLDALIALAQTAFSVEEPVPSGASKEGWIYGARL